MRAWPMAMAFEALPEWRSAYVGACEAMEIYGECRESWRRKFPGLDAATAKYIWDTAEKLLNTAC